jgi:MFS family permease
MLLAQLVMIGWLLMQGVNLNPFTLMPIMFLLGLGQGATVPRLMGTVLSNVSPANAGAASGVLSTTQQVAFSIGVSVIGSIFFTALGARGNAASSENYVRAFIIVMCCNFSLLLAALLLLARLTRASNISSTVSHDVVTMEV